VFEENRISKIGRGEITNPNISYRKTSIRKKKKQPEREGERKKKGGFR